MISKMNKLTMLVYHKEYEAFLEKLRDAGVVHIVERGSGAADTSEVQELLAEYNRYSRMIKNLELLAPNAVQGVANEKDADALLARAEELFATLEKMKQALQIAEKDAATMSVWGDFDFSLIEKLRNEGYEVGFFRTMVREFAPEWSERYNAVVVRKDGSRLYFVTVTHIGDTIEMDAEQMKLPNTSLRNLNAEVERLRLEIQLLDEQLASFAMQNIRVLRAAQARLQQDMEFSKVMLDGEKVTGDKLLLLQGWVPEDDKASLLEILDKECVFYEISKPKLGDNVPVKFKNNAFTRMYEVLTRMYGMPSGTDFDPTPIVAPFFSLFFAFCMGDAGYGLVLILLGFILKRKLSKELAGMMNLVITLGIFTTFIGALFGTFFGMSLLGSDIPQNLKNFIISGKMELFGTEYDKQMILALAIGVVHISIAMTVKAINNTIFYGIKETLATWGWWLVVVGGSIIGTLSFLSLIPADVSKWVFIVVGGIGAVLIYLLNDLKRNVLLNVGVGLWDTYNMAAGLLGDILSYIRLFALGLAGGMLGQTFNSLALMVVDGAEGIGAVIGWIGFGLIIIFGHTLNIAMSCLSAFVHPLRLTFVEYFKNAGYDGKGVEYKPFKKQ